MKYKPDSMKQDYCLPFFHFLKLVFAFGEMKLEYGLFSLTVLNLQTFSYVIYLLLIDDQTFLKLS